MTLPRLRPGHTLRACFAALVVLLAGVAAALAAPLNPPPRLLAAFEVLRNGHYTQALEMARTISVERPDDPLPPLLEAQAQFDLIFCQTAHINGREVWHLTEVDKTPLDPLLTRSLSQAAKLSEALERDPATAALGHFYDGTAHGFRARLSTLRIQTLASGREGKRMREELLEAAALDPSLALETDIGLGLYDYYADSLSPIIKLFRFFLFIPGGNMERGIARLRAAAAARSLAAVNGGNHEPAHQAVNGPAAGSGANSAAPAILFQPEARWELARIVGVREGHHEEAVNLLAPLVQRYPDNALFALLAGLEAEGTGNLELAGEYLKKAGSALPRMEDSCRPRLEPAVQEAASRIAEALRAQQEQPPQ